MQNRCRWLKVSSLVLITVAAACSDAELVGIHIALAKDGSGTVTARSLQPSTAAGAAESKARGVQWQVRATLQSSQGTFRNLSDLAFGDSELRFLTSNDEMPHLRVMIKRGKDLTWVQTLVPEQSARRDLAKVHDPSGKTREIADSIRIEIQLPADAISSGVQPTGRGIEYSHERNRAWLILPVPTLLEAGDELAWDVSWR